MVSMCFLCSSSNDFVFAYVFRDLYGMLGFPKRVSRTVISGKKKDLVLKFLFVLTYFIRCNELRQSAEEMESDCSSFEHMMPNHNDLSDILECDGVSTWLGRLHEPGPSKSDDPAPQASNSEHSQQNKYKMRGCELGLRLCLETQSGQGGRPSCSSNSNEADDVFLCRTPDIDSGISEESTEDSVAHLSKSDPATFDLQQSDSAVTLCPNVEAAATPRVSFVADKDVREENDDDDSGEAVATPRVSIVIDSTADEDAGKENNGNDSDVNDDNVMTITQTSQLLKEYLSVRYDFQRNLSALGKSPDEGNPHEDCEGHRRKITDAKNKFYVRSESLGKQDDDGAADGCTRTNCECSKCKEKISKFNFNGDRESVSTIDEYTLTNLAEIGLPQ